MLILPRTEQSIVLTKWVRIFFFYKKEFKYLLADLKLCGNMEWELSLYRYALFLQQQVLITHEKTISRLFQTTLVKWGSFQASLVSVDSWVFV